MEKFFQHVRTFNSSRENARGSLPSSNISTSSISIVLYAGFRIPWNYSNIYHLYTILNKISIQTYLRSQIRMRKDIAIIIYDERISIYTQLK